MEGKIAETQILVRCYNCGGDTEHVLQVLKDPPLAATQQRGITKSISCKYCGHLNVIKIPASWDSRPLILGDESFLGYSQGMPIFQGKNL